MKLSRVGYHSNSYKINYPHFVADIKNQHVQSIIELLSKRNKTLDIIQKMSYILQQLLQFSYFKLLKSKLTEIDYFTVIEKLTLSFKETDSVIIEKGKRNDHFYIVLFGEVDVLDQISPTVDDFNEEYQRKYQIINTLYKGDTFGQSSLVNYKRQTKARVQAKTNTVLLLLPFQVFNKTILKITVMRKQQIIDLFMKSSLFIDIDPDSLKDLASQIYQFRFGLNQTIYLEGSKHDHFYFIKNGTVEIFQNQVKLVTIPAGEYFGIEDKQLQDKLRSQSAVSRSSDLVIYKIPFSRLFNLNHYEDRFLRNLKRDFNGKQRVYKKLIHNHFKVEKLINNHSLGQKIIIKKKKPKGKTIPLQPVWWGITRKVKEINRCSSTILQIKQKQKQNQYSRSGILGTKRINLLRHSININKQQQTLAPSLSSVITGSLPHSLSIKIVKKNIMSSDAESLKRKLVPQIQKNKLLKYAKSGVDTCQSMFWI